MCEVDDNWAKKAMDDATLVANLLLRLKNTTTSSPSLNLNWTVRQRRSRSNRHVPADKKTEPARASPTTPLSWSAATSASGPASAAAADGSEESSRLTKPVHASRSNKIDEQSETATANKRSRKKRSLPELLEEEKLLLEERRTLKDELASMHLTVEKQRAKNESLKRMKLDLVSRQSSKTATTIPLVSGKSVLVSPQLVEAQSGSSKLVLPPQTVQEKVIDDESLVCAANASSRQYQEIGNQGPLFLLPDLNLPLEEEEFNFN